MTKQGLVLGLMVVGSWLMPAWSQSVPRPTGTEAGLWQAAIQGVSPRAFPLKDTEIDLEITGHLVHAQLRQIFLNDSQRNQEAVYRFPLPTEATITDMRLIFEDRDVISVVREKQVAQAVYAEARDAGRKTALLEKQAGQLFTTRVANFLPGETVTVEIAMVFPLTMRRGQKTAYELRFPTTFAQRYLPVAQRTHQRMRAIPGDSFFDWEPMVAEGLGGPFERDANGQASLQQPRLDEQNPHLFRFEMKLHKAPEAHVWSQTHVLTVTHALDGSQRVSLAGTYDRPDRDLVVVIEPNLASEPSVRLHQSVRADSAHGLVTILPPTADQVDVWRRPREVVFLIDTSGSMAGVPMAQAKRGLQECLGLLDPMDRFNIVRYSSDHSALAKGFLPVTTEALNEAAFFVQRLQSNGGTEMQTALSSVLALPNNADYLRMVVLLTDGAVGNALTLQRLLQTKRGEARLFTFGVGSAPNAYLMRKMAKIGRGESFFLEPGEDIGVAISRFFHTVRAPVLTDVAVTWVRKNGREAKELSYFPQQLPDLYAQRPLQLVYRDRKPFQGTLQVSGQLGDRPVSYEFAVDGGEPTVLPAVETLFGQSLVTDLMDSWLANDSLPRRESLRQEIVAVGLNYGLVTRFTSRVAVERSLVNKTQQPAQRVDVANLSPRNEGYPATASRDPGQFLLGAVMVLLGFYLIVVDRRRTHD